MGAYSLLEKIRPGPPSLRILVRVVPAALIVIVLFFLFASQKPREIIAISGRPPPVVPPPPRPSDALNASNATNTQNTQNTQKPQNTQNTKPTWQWSPEHDADNFGLSEEQCLIAFPKQYADLDKSVSLWAERRIKPEDLDARPVHTSLIRAMIYEGQLFIIEYGPQTQTQSRGPATLFALHRALTAFPDRHLLPNIEFVLTTEDYDKDEDPTAPIWAYTKQDEDDLVWMMPDFGYFSWPESKVGAYHEMRKRIMAVDEGGLGPDGNLTAPLPFHNKTPQIVWRGVTWTNEEIRGQLMEVTKDQSWADVQVIDWGDRDNPNSNLIPIEDHCRYMFAAQTEGKSYSGRAKYLLNCRSVTVSHPTLWREPHQSALVAEGPDANYVEVYSDWSDLPQKIQYFIDHPAEAERIANNSIATFRDRYLTNAAEACYWRQLIRKWGSVMDFQPAAFIVTSEGKLARRGDSYEDWALKGPRSE
ncbi:Lipopolysaccharide-modifying protein [Penicillium alfredii]|uniref:Lipopolysaccharide-modifying protein n=1 Tax=Penicillium alfredii TaxID=1506179 RepID=A0A9W9ESC1_9EURO|nr:Lipopolysaccharide-modifying protein [Penicillium alfredii]KAJ5086989.1 Lipopolysaccharide-modifying protein [Penicillium alfredii]